MSTTVTDLVRNFADACRALVPMLTKVCVPWDDAQQYDNWDRIAEALFETFVIEPCRYQSSSVEQVASIKIAPYGFAPKMIYSAFLSIKTLDHHDYRFRQLASVNLPFDHCLGDTDSGERIIALSAAEFAFVCLGQDGTRREIKTVDLSL